MAQLDIVRYKLALEDRGVVASREHLFESGKAARAGAYDDDSFLGGHRVYNLFDVQAANCGCCDIAASERSR
jgi:hypothetical protein